MLEPVVDRLPAITGVRRRLTGAIDAIADLAAAAADRAADAADRTALAAQAATMTATVGWHRLRERAESWIERRLAPLGGLVGRIGDRLAPAGALAVPTGAVAVALATGVLLAWFGMPTLPFQAPPVSSVGSADPGDGLAQAPIPTATDDGPTWLLEMPGLIDPTAGRRHREGVAGSTPSPSATASPQPVGAPGAGVPGGFGTGAPLPGSRFGPGFPGTPGLGPGPALVPTPTPPPGPSPTPAPPPPTPVPTPEPTPPPTPVPTPEPTPPPTPPAGADPSCANGRDDDGDLLIDLLDLGCLLGGSEFDL